MVTGIMLAATVVGILGILIGIFLGVANEKSRVQVNEKKILIRNELPGNNCGGCGCAGYGVPAKAIVVDQADVGTCPTGDAPVVEKTGEIMGVTGGAAGRKVAFVRCAGTRDKTKVQHDYCGIDDCKKIPVVPGAEEKACVYGYIGHSPCVKACVFDVIHMVDDMAVVGKERCMACGMCAALCPNHLTELVPYEAEYLVRCSSRDKGRDVKVVCAVGHIGCTLCIKQCELDTIHMESSLAVTDYEKCTNYGRYTEKCPVKAIV